MHAGQNEHVLRKMAASVRKIQELSEHLLEAFDNIGEEHFMEDIVGEPQASLRTIVIRAAAPRKEFR